MLFRSGARRWDRVSAITRSGILFNVVITGTVIAAALIFDRPLLMLFVPEGSAVLGIAQHINVIATWGFVLFGATMVLFGSSCGYLKARDELNKGVSSMRGAKFKDAADKMQAEMTKVIAAAKGGKADDLKAVFAGAAGSCKNCHDNFRSQ